MHSVFEQCRQKRGRCKRAMRKPSLLPIATPQTSGFLLENSIALPIWRTMRVPNKMFLSSARRLCRLGVPSFARSLLLSVLFCLCFCSSLFLPRCLCRCYNNSSICYSRYASRPVSLERMCPPTVVVVVVPHVYNTRALSYSSTRVP